MTDKPITRPYRVEVLQNENDRWRFNATYADLAWATAKAIQLSAFAGYAVRIIDRRTNQVIETRNAQ